MLHRVLLRKTGLICTASAQSMLGRIHLSKQNIPLTYVSLSLVRIMFVGIGPSLEDHTHGLSRGPLPRCTRCVDLLSLGGFKNLELDDTDALVPPPLDGRLLPAPLGPLLFEDRDEKRENTEEEGGVKGGLLEELCLLSGTGKMKVY